MVRTNGYLPMTSVQPAPAGLRRRKRERTADRIYTVAVRLFTERGFENVTVQDITDAAHVGKGTFFNYFPTKEAVLNRFLEEYGEDVRDFAEALPEGLAPSESLGALITFLGSRILEDVTLSRLVLLASVRSRTLGEGNRAASTDFRGAVGLVLARGQAAGTVRRDVPPERMAEYLVSCIFRILRDYLELDQEFDLQDRLAELVDLCVRGMEVPAAGAPLPGSAPAPILPSA